MMQYTPSWYDPSVCFGLHTDLHILPQDTQTGARADATHIADMLALAKADFAQTDCKGHPGITCWPSLTPEATVAQPLHHDVLRAWREATRSLGIPLHAHYSGLWDGAAGLKHPEWCAVGPDGKPYPASGTQMTGRTETPAPPDRICPRSPYLEELMIPQMLELIDHWDIEGFWIDGDIWGMKLCYCPRCRNAFTAQTGIAEPPVEKTDSAWPRWVNFHRESFETYVTRYCDAVHTHRPGVKVCSNWMQTFLHPGEPVTPVDWISGDNVPPFSLDRARCEARFLSTRGKHWDVMIWAFYTSHGFFNETSPYEYKPLSMMLQETAVYQAFGGAVQTCISPLFQPPRDSRLAAWVMQRQGALSDIVHDRRPHCADTETWPQVAVLHSEHHYRANMRGGDILYGDSAPVEGAVYALLECHLAVDVLDEWAIGKTLREYPVVVVPEQQDMSDEMAEKLVTYAKEGGYLLLTGGQRHPRFDETVTGAKVTGFGAGVFHIPVADGAATVYSETFAWLEPTKGEGWKNLCRTLIPDENTTPCPACVFHALGKGMICTVPYNIFRFFHAERYISTRALVGAMLERLGGGLAKFEVPPCVDVVMRKQGRDRLVHLINRDSGIPQAPNNGAVDQVLPVCDLRFQVALPEKPTDVTLPLGGGKVEHTYENGILSVWVDTVRIHQIVKIHG